MSSSTNSITILTDIFTNPNKAFEDIKVDYPKLFPILTIIVLNAALVLLLFMNIDYQWYIEELVQRLSNADSSQEEIADMRKGLEMMSANTTGAMGAVFGGIAILVMFVVMTLYFVIISAITNDGLKFKQWFSFVSWTSMPSVIGTLSGFVVVLTSSNGQIMPEAINPLSLNELFFGLDATKGIGAILAGTGITAFWTFALMIIGYANWTGKTKGMSVVVISALYAVSYGLWFLMV